MTDAETVERLRAQVRFWRPRAERTKDAGVLIAVLALLLGPFTGAVAAGMGGMP